MTSYRKAVLLVSHLRRGAYTPSTSIRGSADRVRRQRSHSELAVAGVTARPGPGRLGVRRVLDLDPTARARIGTVGAPLVLDADLAEVYPHANRWIRCFTVRSHRPRFF